MKFETMIKISTAVGVTATLVGVAGLITLVVVLATGNISC